jgi:hypothetical protein
VLGSDKKAVLGEHTSGHLSAQGQGKNDAMIS